MSGIAQNLHAHVALLSSSEEAQRARAGDRYDGEFCEGEEDGVGHLHLGRRLHLRVLLAAAAAAMAWASSARRRRRRAGAAPRRPSATPRPRPPQVGRHGLLFAFLT